MLVATPRQGRHGPIGRVLQVARSRPNPSPVGSFLAATDGSRAQQTSSSASEESPKPTVIAVNGSRRQRRPAIHQVAGRDRCRFSCATAGLVAGVIAAPCAIAPQCIKGQLQADLEHRTGSYPDATAWILRIQASAINRALLALLYPCTLT